MGWEASATWGSAISRITMLNASIGASLYARRLRRVIEQLQPAREDEGNDGRDHEADADAERDDTHRVQRLRGVLVHAAADPLQPDAGGGDDQPRLHGPEDAAHRRTDRARAFHRDRRGLEEAAAGRRLDVWQQLVIRSQAIQHLAVHL